VENSKEDQSFSQEELSEAYFAYQAQLAAHRSSSSSSSGSGI